VYAWLNEQTGEPAFVYSEITGYFLSLCANLHAVDPQGPWRERAVRAATWITEVAQHPSGGVLTRKFAQGKAGDDPFAFERGLTLFFDATMVGYGLMNTYAITHDERWLAAAKKIGDFCVERFQDPEGKRHWAIDLHTMAALPEAARWSQHFGPFELKGAMFLHALSEATHEPRYEALTQALLKNTLAAQRPEGRFPTYYPNGEATHLHPNAYVIEGLLYLAAHAGRSDLLDPAARALDWAFRTCLVRPDRLHQWSDNPALTIRGLRSDVVAQCLRAYCIAKALKPTLHFEWETHLPELWTLLDSYLMPSGGTAYGVDETGQKLNHANAWCHFFGMEARLFRTRLENGTLDPRALVIT